MIDFAVFVKALSQGTPWAILIAAIGAVWQLIYVYTRDKAKELDAQRAYELEQAKFLNQKAIEEKKFKYQKAIETLRFEYEKRRWREQLALQLASKHVDTRLVEYTDLWSEVRVIARHNANEGALTRDSARATAAAIEKWRYSKGGLSRRRPHGMLPWHYKRHSGTTMKHRWPLPKRGRPAGCCVPHSVPTWA